MPPPEWGRIGGGGNGGCLRYRKSLFHFRLRLFILLPFYISQSFSFPGYLAMFEKPLLVNEGPMNEKSIPLLFPQGDYIFVNEACCCPGFCFNEKADGKEK